VVVFATQGVIADSTFMASYLRAVLLPRLVKMEFRQEFGALHIKLLALMSKQVLS